MYSHSVHVTTSSTVHFLTYNALYLRPEYKKKGNACMHHGPFFSAQGSGPKGRGEGRNKKNKNWSREFPIFIFIFCDTTPPQASQVPEPLRSLPALPQRRLVWVPLVRPSREVPSRCCFRLLQPLRAPLGRPGHRLLRLCCLLRWLPLSWGRFLAGVRLDWVVSVRMMNTLVSPSSGVVSFFALGAFSLCGPL